MHRDKKVGLAMGILLVGIVAAFFFRNESDPLEDIPPLEDALALDEKIAAQAGGPYLTGVEPVDDRYRTSGPVPSLDSSVLDSAPKDTSDVVATADSFDTLAPVNVIEQDSEPLPSAAEVTVGMPFGSVLGESTVSTSNEGDWESIPPFVPDAVTVSPQVSQASQTKTLLPKQEVQESVEKSEVQEPFETVDVSVTLEEAEPFLDEQPMVVKPERFVPSAKPRTYRIRPGDTLSEIAWRELGSSRRYHELYEANRDRLKHPDNLPVGMELRIPVPKRTTQQNRSDRESAKVFETEVNDVDRTSSRRFIPMHESPIR
ncbi:LysM peptidoglycan-binding domain-containing protein [Thalassoroseus pseudoceratinae]|uniref:LysM peptidoglycan-binding domain-containing protein n=1 Tax=Thalassoroseus pseudoceratinae TaxID=2713176 RepID=UPI001420233C|nr:LysM peptidoglycan-binding domain-containing protein [Thalassoroseus pseudoceratinae]